MTAVELPPSIPGARAPLLGAALAYAARGWYVLPCRVGQKQRADTGETIKDVHLPRHWDQSSSVDPLVLAAWFGEGGEWEYGSVALDTGKSGLVVVDLDCSGAKNGLAAWAEVGGLSAAYVVATPSGGAHLYYAADPDRPVGIDSRGKVAHGVDVRGIGGLVIAPPSADWRGAYRGTGAADWKHLSPVPDIVAERVPLGGRAATSVGASPPSTAPSGDPSALAQFRLPPGTPRYTVAEANRRIMAALETVAQTPEGSGFNHALNEASFELGHWVAGGHLDHADAEQLLSYVVTQQFPHGPNGDDLATIDSGLGAGQARPYAVFTERAHAVLAAGQAQPGPGFARVPAGSITHRPVMPPPTVYDPGDGALLYPEGIHWLFGESGSGKTWVAMHAVASVLKTGGTALYLDYEDNLAACLERLAALGVDDEQVTLLAYVDGHNTNVQDIAANLALGESFTISVIDGVTTALNEFGVSGRNEDEVTKWADAIPRSMTGAVMCIDHVVKDKDARGGYAIGSQAKKNVVTGASYEVVCDVPLGKGKAGRVRAILRKDKRGSVHVSVGEVAARLEFTSSPDGTVMAVRPLSERQTDAPTVTDAPAVMLVAAVLEAAHERGDVNLQDSIRKLRDWVKGHGHLIGEGGSRRNDDLDDAIRYARGWAGLPGVHERYRLKPLGLDLGDSAQPVEKDVE